MGEGKVFSAQWESRSSPLGPSWNGGLGRRSQKELSAGRRSLPGRVLHGSPDGSVRTQWARADRGLFGLLTIGWIFTPLCNETGVAVACPGKNLPFGVSAGGREGAGRERRSDHVRASAWPGPLRPVHPRGPSC